MGRRRRIGRGREKGSTMIEVSAAENAFREMLRDAGVDFRAPDVQTIWHVFKSFVQTPVNCSDDGVLFECGVFSFTGKPLFYADFCRQFSVDVEGEYDHMEQLHCRLTCEPTDDLKDQQTNLWAEGFSSLSDFFTAVEGLDEFKAVVNGKAALRCRAARHLDAAIEENRQPLSAKDTCLHIRWRSL